MKPPTQNLLKRKVSKMSNTFLSLKSVTNIQLDYNLLTISVPLLQRDTTLEKKEDLFDHSFVQNLQKSFSGKNPSVPAN